MKSKEFVSEIKNLTVGELHKKAESIAEELSKLRFRKAASQLEQTHLYGTLRRNLARVKTFLSKSDRGKSA